jgi:hypothetical protein
MDRTSGIITEYIMTAHGTDWLLDLEVAMVTEVPHQSTLRTKARLFRSTPSTSKINY